MNKKNAKTDYASRGKANRRLAILTRLLGMERHPEYPDCWWRVKSKPARGFVPLHLLHTYMQNGARPLAILNRLQRIGYSYSFYSVDDEPDARVGINIWHRDWPDHNHTFNREGMEIETLIPDAVAEFLDLYGVKF